MAQKSLPSNRKILDYEESRDTNIAYPKPIQVNAFLIWTAWRGIFYLQASEFWRAQLAVRS